MGPKLSGTVLGLGGPKRWVYDYAGSLKCGVLSELGVVSVRFPVRFSGSRDKYPWRMESRDKYLWRM